MNPPNAVGLLCDICGDPITDGTVGLTVWMAQGGEFILATHQECWTGAIVWAGQAMIRERKSKMKEGRV